jgi:zinc/manganese transport system substrate-binding protein
MSRCMLSLALLAVLAAPAAAEPLQVVTTLTDLAAVVREVGGDRVEAVALTTGYEAPHYISPTPALMKRVQNADLFVQVGLQLELWSQRLLQGAGNPRVRVGQPGHLYASDGIARLQKPAAITRREGDLHPDGNPHMWIDPLAVKQIARNIAGALTRLQPDGKDDFEARLADFEKRIDRALLGAQLYDLSPKLSAVLIRMLKNKGIDSLFAFLEKKQYKGATLMARLGGWLGTAQALRGKPIVFYHRSWIYFAERFGLRIEGYVEEKPGIKPSAKHRDALAKLMKEGGVRVVAASNYYPASIGEQVATDANARFVSLPNHVNGVEEATDTFAFFDLILSRLAKAYGE